MTGKKPMIVGDTKGMTQEEFARSRIGIGGSDQATLAGLSPWNSLYGLWSRCRGKKRTVFKPDEEEDYRLEKGHLLEPLVAEVFRRKTGFRVFDDTSIFAREDYPFLRANIDRFYERESIRETGERHTVRGILELKTTFPESQDVWNLWKKGICPEHYRLQVLFYMMVLDLDEAYVACMWGFDEKKDYVHIRIERDMEEEAELLKRNVDFWDQFVIPGKKPPLTFSRKPEAVIRDIRAYTGFADPEAPCVIFQSDYLDDVHEIEAIDREIQSLKNKMDGLAEMKKKLQIPFVEAMGNSVTGILACGDGDYYEVAYKPRGKSVVPVAKLLYGYPDLVEKYTKVLVTDLRADYPAVFEKVSEKVGEDSRQLTIRKKKFNEKSRSAYERRLKEIS